MSIVAPSPTSVYLYYDRHDSLIYVGITSRGIGRQREHNKDKDWWPHVARQDVEHHKTRAAAEKRERELINHFAPPFNTQHNPIASQARAAYLAHCGTGGELPADKRIALRVIPDTAAGVVSLLTLPDAVAATSRIVLGDAFPISVSPKRRARLTGARKLGASLALRLSMHSPDEVASAVLMFKHDGPTDLHIKRLDINLRGAA